MTDSPIKIKCHHCAYSFTAVLNREVLICPNCRKYLPVSSSPTSRSSEPVIKPSEPSVTANENIDSQQTLPISPKQWLSIGVAIFVLLVIIAALSSGNSSSKSTSTTLHLVKTITKAEKFTIDVPAAQWSQITNFINSPASDKQYASEIDFINSTTCGYPNVKVTAHPEVSVLPTDTGESITVSLSSNQHYWYNQALKSCAVDTPKSDYEGALTPSIIEFNIKNLTEQFSTAKAKNVPFKFSIQIPLSEWYGINKYVSSFKSVGISESVVQWISLGTCAYDDPNGQLPTLNAHQSSSSTELLEFTFTQENLGYWTDSLGSDRCSDSTATSVKQEFVDALSPERISHFIGAIASTPKLTWTQWKVKATSALVSGSIDISSCIYSPADAAAITSAANSTPVDDGTLNADLKSAAYAINLIKSGGIGQCNTGVPAMSWNQAIKLINQDLKIYGISGISASVSVPK